MATTASEPHTIVQSWVSVELARELKAHARATGCSLSSLVRDALEGSFVGETAARGGRLLGSSGPRRASAKLEREAEDEEKRR